MTAEDAKAQNTLAELVDEFLSRPRNCCDEDEYYSKLEDIEDAIHKASYAVTVNGLRSSHQRRGVTQTTMEETHAALRAAKSSLSQCKDFHELWELIGKIISPIHGSGDLYIYDTSRRIGAFLDLYPSRVYLHRGTREGAKALGLDYNRPYINMVSLPPELRRLEPKHIEDFLCVCKDELATVHR